MQVIIQLSYFYIDDYDVVWYGLLDGASDATKQSGRRTAHTHAIV